MRTLSRLLAGLLLAGGVLFSQFDHHAKQPFYQAEQLGCGFSSVSGGIIDFVRDIDADR